MKLNYQTNLKKFVNLRNSKKWKIWTISTIMVVWVLFFCFCYFFSDFKFSIPNSIHQWKIIAAAICGLFLSLSGQAMQGVTRNELAGPSTLGFMPLTTTGLIFYLLLDKAFPNTLDIYLKYVLTIVLSLFVMGLIYLIAIKKSYNQSLIILLGLAIGIAFGALNFLLMRIFPELLVSSSPWLGQIQIFVDWKLYYYSIPLMVIGAIIILLNGKKINIIENNLDLATTLGINHKKIFWYASIGSVFIAVGSSFLIGSIIGIAIVIPYLSKKILATNNFYLNSVFSSFFTSIILLFAMLMNTVYAFGLNLFAVIIVLPIFLIMIIRRKM